MFLSGRARLAVITVLLAACDSGFGGVAAPVDATAPEPPAVEPGETRRLARTAADAALACAQTCVISVWSDGVGSDSCLDNASAPKVQALGDAARALTARIGGDAGVARGEAAAFATTALLFADWMNQGLALKHTQGTLALFQDVADAWNAYQPKDPLPVDPVEEYRLYDYGSKGYVMRPLGKSAGRAVWWSCYDGPCLMGDWIHY